MYFMSEEEIHKKDIEMFEKEVDDATKEKEKLEGK